MKKRVFVVLANVLVLLALLLVSDFIAGFLYPRLAPEYGRKNLEILLNPGAVPSLMERPHPYMLWENTPDYVAWGFRQFNAQGYRNERDLAAVGTARILVLGGSTSFGYMLERPGESWPGQLEGMLRAEDRDIEVVNGSLLYATSAELLAHYLFRDRYLGASTVIIHVGANDAVPLILAGYTPEYTHFRPGWTLPTVTLRHGEATLLHSNLVRLLYARWLSDGLALPAVNKQSHPFDQPPGFYLDNARHNEPVGFERNLELLLRNIIADGSVPILFPDVFPDEQTYQRLSPESANRAAYGRALHQAIPVAMEKQVAVMRRLASKYRISMIEMPPASWRPEHFLDHLHLSPDGETIKAQFVKKFLQSAP